MRHLRSTAAASWYSFAPGPGQVAAHLWQVLGVTAPSMPLVDESSGADEADDGILLPKAPEREWIAERLATLVAKAGFEHLVLSPLLEANETFFPDPWQGGERSFTRLARRLLTYADLPQAVVEVKIHKDDDVGGSVAPAGIGAQIWFVRKHGNTIHLAARASTLRDPQILVPAMARTVAEAWRAWHGLTQSDAVLEQRLTDLTAIYLGFGLLTTDAAVRHGAERSAGFRLTRTKSSLGVLPPQALCFALALCLSARQAPKKERNRIAKRLQPNQAGFLRTGLTLLSDDPTFVHALNVPAKATWPAPPELATLVEPFESVIMQAEHLGEEPEEPEERHDEDTGVAGMNEGRPVFRVERSKSLRLAKMLALPTVMIGMLLGRMQTGIDIEMWQMGVAAAVLGGLGLGIGRFLRDLRCSEPKCQQTLDPDASTCPRCGGTIAGVIAHPKERLAAEEALDR